MFRRTTVETARAVIQAINNFVFSRTSVNTAKAVIVGNDEVKKHGKVQSNVLNIDCIRALQ